MKKSGFVKVLALAFVLLFLGLLFLWGYSNQTAERRKETDYILLSLGAGLLIAAIFFLVRFGMYFGAGKPKTCLPDNRGFKKLAEDRQGNLADMDAKTYIAHFLLENLLTKKREYFSIPAHLLVDENGRKTMVPNVFRVKIGKRMKDGEKFQKKPKMEEVYYLLKTEDR